MVIALCGVSWAVAMWIPFAMVGEIISDMKDRLLVDEFTSSDDLQGQQDQQQQQRNYGTISSGSTLENDSTTEGGHSNSTSTIPSQGQDDDDDNDDDNDDSDDSDDEHHHHHQHGLTDSELEQERKKQGQHLDAGLVLGVHNLYIVFPQFVDAIVASCLFALIGSGNHNQPSSPLPPSLSPSSSLSTLTTTTTTGDKYVEYWTAGEPEPVGWILRFGGLMALVA
ncbi:hypothetical protein BGZ65_010696, partial [Modicella reniformis]